MWRPVSASARPTTTDRRLTRRLATVTPMSNPPAGWYPDPTGKADTIRWWDGTQWTTRTETTSAADSTDQPVAQGQPVAEAQPVEQQPVAEAQPVLAEPVESAASEPTVVPEA